MYAEQHIQLMLLSYLTLDHSSSRPCCDTGRRVFSIVGGH